MMVLTCFLAIDIDARYLYELRIPPGVPLQLKPSDGEVESFEVRFFAFCLVQPTIKEFQLLELSEVEARIRAGLFKPNCALGEYPTITDNDYSNLPLKFSSTS